MKSPINFATVGPSGPISFEPSLVFVWLSNTAPPLYADSGHDTRTNIRILEILIVIFLDDTTYRLLESGKVRTALGGMLAVHERIIFLSILVAMRDNHLYILPFQVDDRVKSSVVIFSFNKSTRPLRE